MFFIKKNIIINQKDICGFNKNIFMNIKFHQKYILTFFSAKGMLLLYVNNITRIDIE